MIRLNLVEINEPYATYHTYEVSLSAPGEGLVNIDFQESEGMMKRPMQQLTDSVSDSEIISSGKEKGTLSIITEKKFIRRVYLNNKVVPMEVDLCSLVSIVTSDNLEGRKKLEIIRKIEARPLGHEHQIDPGCEIESLAKKTSFLHDDKVQTRRNLDPNITVASDDPRRGGRRGHLDTIDIPSNTSNIRYTGEKMR